MGLAVSEVLGRFDVVHFRTARQPVILSTPAVEKPIVQKKAPDLKSALNLGVEHDDIGDAKSRAQADGVGVRMRLIYFAEQHGLLKRDESGVVLGVRDALRPTVLHDSLDQMTHRINARPRLPTRSTIFGGED